MKMIGVRMPSEHIVLLKKVCKARGEDLSDFVRRAIYKELADLSFLPEEQKKALGVTRACLKSVRRENNE
jgi:hypothetical protein